MINKQVYDSGCSIPNRQSAYKWQKKMFLFSVMLIRNRYICGLKLILNSFLSPMLNIIVIGIFLGYLHGFAHAVILPVWIRPALSILNE